MRNNTKISDYERLAGIQILDHVIDEAPELLDGIDELNEKAANNNSTNNITLEDIKRIVQWDKKNKKLKDFEFVFMSQLADGTKPLTDRNKFIAQLNFNKLKRYGFGE